MNTEWIYYPNCGNKTRTMIQEDTEIKDFPLYCLNLFRQLAQSRCVRSFWLSVFA